MEDVKRAIRLVQKYDCLIDTHTAAGVEVALQYRKLNESMIVAQTAQAWKFDEAVYDAAGVHPRIPARWQQAHNLPERIIRVGKDPQETMDYITRLAA